MKYAEFVDDAFICTSRYFQLSRSLLFILFRHRKSRKITVIKKSSFITIFKRRVLVDFGYIRRFWVVLLLRLDFVVTMDFCLNNRLL